MYRLSLIEKFQPLMKSFTEEIDQWKTIYDSA